jgi:serine/threonine protein kinase
VSATEPSTPPRPSSKLDQLLIGRTIADRYAITGLLARGGMGRVYTGRQLSLERSVVLKVLPGARDLEDRPSYQRRFMREAETCARLEHPNTVTIYDYGELTLPEEDLHLFYIAMEHVQGRSLAATLKEEGPLPLERALRIVWEVARALREAHRKGVIHRDLKPGNVMIHDTLEGEGVKVLDFGIAKLTEEGESEDPITLDNRIIGSPRYMAPEQVLDNAVSPSSDIYSLGIILYEMLCGEVPFARGGATQTMMAQIHQPVPPLRDRIDIPPEAEALVMRCLAKNPKDRFADVEELFAAIRRLDWDDGATTAENTIWTLRLTPPEPTSDLPAPQHRSQNMLMLTVVLNLLIFSMLAFMVFQI